MDGIGKDLMARVARAGVGKQVESAMTLEYAQQALEAVFADDARHVRPQYIKNGTLTVSCDSAAFAQTLKTQEAAVLSHLNEKMPARSRVERIRYLL